MVSGSRFIRGPPAFAPIRPVVAQGARAGGKRAIKMKRAAQVLEGLYAPLGALAQALDHARDQQLDHNEASGRAVEGGGRLDRAGDHMDRPRGDRRAPEVRHQDDDRALRCGAVGEFEHVALIAAEIEDDQQVAPLHIEQMVGPAGAALAHQLRARPELTQQVMEIRSERLAETTAQAEDRAPGIAEQPRDGGIIPAREAAKRALDVFTDGKPDPLRDVAVLTPAIARRIAPERPLKLLLHLTAHRVLEGGIAGEA